MKGFDAAQGLSLSGEAAIHERLCVSLSSSSIPYWAQKVRLWAGRGVADFVWGISERFITHLAELEPAPTWRDGLTQALWYKSAYFQEHRLQCLPTLILFGNMTSARWDEVETTCLDQRVLLLTTDFTIDGEPGPFTIEDLIAPD